MDARQRQVTAIEAASRHKGEAQAKRVPNCDGANTKSVREWIREIGFTIPYSALTVYIAARTAEGTLRREVERYFADQPSRDAVQAIKENACEGTAAYSRRFRDTADLGYPPAHRNDGQHRIMKVVVQIQKQVTRMAKQITRLSAAVGVSGSANTKRVSNIKPKGKYKFTPEGVPICVRCDRPGHVIRECTANKDHQKRAPTGHQRATATYAGGQ